VLDRHFGTRSCPGPSFGIRLADGVARMTDPLGPRRRSALPPPPIGPSSLHPRPADPAPDELAGGWHRVADAPEDAPDEATPLLGADEPRPFRVLNADATTPLLLVCDHASRVIPRFLGDLGLTKPDLARHIAYDIGAAELTLGLAHRLNCTAVLAGYSRIVIDLNRPPGDPESILAVSDGTVVPGNQNLSESEQAQRAEALHWPYHHAVDAAFARLRRIGPEPLLFSVHTFTPSLGGEDRFWDAGVLWNRDPRLAVPLLTLLRRHPGLVIGDNEPYSGLKLSYTLDLHAGTAGLPNCAIEVRQDHCENEADLARWITILGDALAAILAMPHMHRIGESG
jgi:predicted N-formylglutamate amidohydrolase